MPKSVPDLPVGDRADRLRAAIGMGCPADDSRSTRESIAARRKLAASGLASRQGAKERGEILERGRRK